MCQLLLSDIEAVMVVAVREVVDKVASDRIITIVACTFVCSLSSACEICLKGWCSCIKNAQQISIISPEVSECFLDPFVFKLFERLACLREWVQSQRVQLLQRYLATNYTLDYICSVQAVHTVCAEHAFLLGKDVEGPITSANSGNFRWKGSIRLELFSKDSNQLWKVLPLHLLALGVEVEPHVLKVFIIQIFEHSCESVSHSLLWTLLINEIHPVLFTIGCLCFFHMLLSRLETFIEVPANNDRWWPGQIGLHSPVECNTASDLNVGGQRHMWFSLLLLDKNVLCFNKVRCISIFVKASHDKTTSRSTAVLARNKIELELRVDDSVLEESINHRCPVRHKLWSWKLREQIVIEGKLSYITRAVRPHVPRIGHIWGRSRLRCEKLHILSQVHLVWEVESIVLLEFLNHIHIGLVLLIYGKWVLSACKRNK